MNFRATLVLFALFAPSIAAGQAASRPAFSTGALWAVPPSEEPVSRVTSDGIFGDGSRDYRYAGFWVGAATGVGLAYTLHQFCEGSDNGCQASLGAELLGTLFVAGMMGTMGALLGAQFSREAPQSASNPE